MSQKNRKVRCNRMERKIYSRAKRCPKCGSNKYYGDIYKFECMKCGHIYELNPAKHDEPRFMNIQKPDSVRKKQKGMSHKDIMKELLNEKVDKGDMSKEDAKRYVSSANRGNKSRYIIKDCPTICPRCQSKNTNKDGSIYRCQKCGHFDTIEAFEGV